MKKTYQYKSIGADLIELPEDYISGTVEINGYTINEVGGTRLIIIDPVPPVDEELEIKYEILEKPVRQTPAKKALEDKVFQDLLKTIAIQQEEIKELKTMLRTRVTYQHLDAVTKHLSSRLELIKEHLGID